MLHATRRKLQLLVLHTTGGNHRRLHPQYHVCVDGDGLLWLPRHSRNFDQPLLHVRAQAGRVMFSLGVALCAGGGQDFGGVAPLFAGSGQGFGDTQQLCAGSGQVFAGTPPLCAGGGQGFADTQPLCADGGQDFASTPQSGSFPPTQRQRERLVELIATFARMTGRPITPATVATHAELAPLEGSTAQDLACLQVPEPGALLCTQVTLVKGKRQIIRRVPS